MTDLARTMILIGVLFLVIGGIMLLVGKFPGAGKLPGDIVIKKENFSFYFPLTTCIIVSIVLTLISYLWRK
jgi:hypothetical protein